MLLTDNNIKAELSDAYLHAVAARAGIGCEVSGRHSDGAGVDATLRARERFQAESILTHFTIEIQLKATSQAVKPNAVGRYPFVLEVEHYNKLRDPGNQALHLLVILFLPPDPNHWLGHSPEGLTSRRCAYWTSLRDAPPCANETSQTVYLPEINLFNVEGLRGIMARRSLGGWINHEL